MCPANFEIGEMYMYFSSEFMCLMSKLVCVCMYFSYMLRD